MRKRVVFILHSAQCGGTEKVMIHIANELPRETYRPAILFVDKQGPLISIISPDVEVLSLGKKRISRSLISLIRVIRHHRPDIILSSISHLNIAVLLIAPILSNKTKIFVRESNITSVSLVGAKHHSLFLLMIKILYPKAQKVICLGNTMVKDLSMNFRIPENRISTIYNPVDADAVLNAALSSQNPFRANKFNLLAVGSLTYQKGFDLLLEAMALARPHAPGLHLTILGDGPLKDDLIRHISVNGLGDAVTLAGFKANPYPFFYYADRFVLSSRYEGLPNVVLEAVALGTEIIAFDSPGCIRDIITDPSLGTLVTPCTAEALARAIVQSRRNHDSRIAPTLQEKFKLHTIVRQYQSVFEE